MLRSAAIARLTNPPLIGDDPNPIWFRTAYFAAGTIFPSQRQAYGKLLYPVSGILELNIEGVRYLSPPAYAIWIPPKSEHSSVARQDIYYTVVYIEADLCTNLALAACTLELSAVIKAIAADFAERGIAHPISAEDLRMAHVVVDKVRLAPRYDNYLPSSDNAWVRHLLEAIQAAPDDRQSLADWARSLGTTERTLSRRFREHLGITFSEWRQRAKLVAAISLLEEDHSVQTISHKLGYSNASAFITMFRQLTGVSPTKMRQRNST
jgi:AraC-like DNA-binding protein